MAMVEEATDTRPTWRQPVWLVGHVVALVGVVTFALLGWWQFTRHQDRSVLDDILRSRVTAEVVPLETMGDSIDDIEYRRVAVVGVFDTAEEVVWRARTRAGVSGHHVVTPLVLEDGTAVLVDRGWVPIQMDTPPIAEAAPPAGTTTVVGIVRKPQPSGGLGPRDPAEGELDKISRLIPERLAPQLERPLETRLYVQRVEAAADDGELPLIGTLPEPGRGPPHLSYAVQWWVFAGVVVIGYPVLLARTQAKRRRHVG